jgi:2-methylcitrate dehydratase PrpD
VSTVLVAAAEGMDLRAVIAATDQLRRAGVLLNQALHHAYVHGNFDAASAAAVVAFIQRLRGRS